jgi:predicted transcriptional regulator
MAKSADKKEEKNNEELNLENFISMNPIRSNIIGLLQMYPELSYTELSKKMKKSKSTIHPHLQKLLDVGIIRFRSKKQRGGNPPKYYSIDPETAKKSVIGTIDKSKGIDKKVAQKIITKEKSKIIVLKGVLEMYIRFWELLEENLEEAPKILEQMPTILSDFSDTRFHLTKEEYEQWYEKYFEKSVEFGTYLAKKRAKDPLVAKPYYFFATFLPLKQIYEKTTLNE